MPKTPPPAAGASGGLTERLAADLLQLDAELREVDLLITQAKAEAVRHEGRRSAAADKLAALPEGPDPKERLDASAALITLTKRAALMETQVDVLEGKRRALARYRDAVAEYLAGAEGVPFVPAAAITAGAPASGAAVADGTAVGDIQLPAAVSRLVLSAQEDMRREIARAMHDGPAQSLTNIVLQAQIVERLVARDPASASGEIRQLTAMVQQTLDATKSFIFDVRPMVLDDLGLVPTLRRAARERGRRAGIPVDFDSMGQDRRLPMDLESGLFRMLDEGLTAFLGEKPDRVVMKVDWGEQLEARLTAVRARDDAGNQGVGDGSAGGPAAAPEGKGADLPPALAAMIEQREADHRDAVEAARLEALVVLPAGVWREIQGRAASIGVTAELLEEGSELHLSAELPIEDGPEA
jgi:two-component system sensor histidine kinase DegS